MGTTLTGTTPQDTYDSLIKVTDNGPLSGTAKYLSDGLGNDSALALSTSLVGIGTATPDTKLTTLVADNTFAAKFKATNGVFRILPFETGLGVKVSAVNGNESAFASLVSQGNDHQFVVGTSEAMRITSAGNVGIGTSSPASKLQVNGGDVRILNVGTQLVLGSGVAGLYEIGATTGNRLDFSLSGTGTYLSILPTGGITFNGDTAAANALDDYEEGTWTPSLIFSGGGVGITYSIQAGKYVKIGSKVSVNCYIVLSSKGSSTGNARIEGLPFTIPNANGNYCPACVFLDGGITYTGQAQGFGNINSTSVGLGNVSEAGTATALTNTNFSNNSAIMISLTYLVS